MSNVNVQLQDENGNNTFPYTYTNNVFDKNGNPINDRLLYGTREAITILPTVTTPASQNMITEQYDTTKTYPTYSKYCIYNNQLYKYSGASGTTTTGTFDNTKWTATNVIDSIDWNTLNNKPSNIAYAGPALATENVPAIDAYLHKSDVVDNFTDGGTEVPLSAECGKLLNSTLAVASGISMEAVTVKSGVSIDVMGSQVLYKYGHFCFVHLCFQATGAISAGTVIFELPTGSYQGLGNYAAYATDGTVKTIDITTDGKIKNGIALASGVKLEFNAPCFRT